jgi:DNA polymerase V
MSIFALLDCNNFFTSCEQVFNPKLKDKPIIVLSNNDGCIIARSNEAKQLGIPMGAPFYSYRALCQKYDVHVFSSNFQLYNDMSNRVMTILEQLVPDMAVYSIDEAFLYLDNVNIDGIIEFVKEIRTKIKKWTGLTVSIGVGPSKTLAKIANKIAKEDTTGIFSLIDPKTQEQILAETEVEEIWGINFRWGMQFRQYGINTALQLRNADSKIIRKYFSLIGERIVLELRGIPCSHLGSNLSIRKNIISSRSFGKRVNNINEIAEAISNYVARACIKLRKQNSRAQGIYVYINTNKFHSNEQQYSHGISMLFPIPTNDTRVIIKIALNCLKRLYKPGFHYHKAGITLFNLTPETSVQKDLFLNTDYSKRDKLMKILDNINTRKGNNTIFLAAQGVKRDWQVRCDRRSPHYTTDWDELPNVYCV